MNLWCKSHRKLPERQKQRQCDNIITRPAHHMLLLKFALKSAYNQIILCIFWFQIRWTIHRVFVSLQTQPAMSVKHAAGTHTRHVWLSQRLPQMRGQLKSVAHVITSPAKIRCVHCDKDTLIPGLLGPPDQRLSQCSVFINVQLHPAHGPRCGLRYFLYGGGGPWAQHHPRVTGQAGCGREETGGDVRTAGWLS